MRAREGSLAGAASRTEHEGVSRVEIGGSRDADCHPLDPTGVWEFRMRMTTGQRVKKRLFQDEPTFARVGGFTTLPLVLRRLQFLFEPRAWQVLTYVMMRTGPEGVAWFSLSELAHDLDFKSISKLKPYVDDLVASGWIRRATSSGLDYYLVRDPLRVIDELRAQGKLTEERQDEIDDLLDSLKKVVPAPPAGMFPAPPALTGFAPPTPLAATSFPAVSSTPAPTVIPQWAPAPLAMSTASGSPPPIVPPPLTPAEWVPAVGMPLPLMGVANPLPGLPVDVLPSLATGSSAASAAPLHGKKRRRVRATVKQS